MYLLLVVNVTEVVAIAVADRRGGLSEVLQALGGVDVEYMYAFPFGCGDKAVLIFRFDQPDAPIERLRAAGIHVVS